MIKIKIRDVLKGEFTYEERNNFIYVCRFGGKPSDPIYFKGEIYLLFLDYTYHSFEDKNNIIYRAYWEKYYPNSQILNTIRKKLKKIPQADIYISKEKINF